MPTSLTPLITLDGSPLADDWLNSLIEIRIEREFQVPSRLTLRFTDPGYELLDKKTVALGTQVEVKEYDGPELVEAEVVAVSAEQVPGAQPEMVVVALDRSHRMARSPVIKVYNDMTYSQIVEKVVSGAGLSPQVDSTPATIPYLMQAESDLALLTELAHRTGFNWWMEGSTLNFAKPAKKGEVELTLGLDLRSFSVRASALPPAQVTVDGWDRVNQEQVTAQATSADIPKASSDLADLVQQAAGKFGSGGVLTAGLGAQSQDEATNLAQNVLDRATAAAVTAKGVADGNASITLGAVAKVKDAGPLTGEYPITKVEHLYRASTGFVTRFTSGERRPTSLVDTLGGRRFSAVGGYAGAAHTRNGVTVATVSSNNDPNNSGRVKVTFPGLADQSTGWARVVAVGGGSKRGSVWIPEVGDEVLVAFEGGDARQPVVLGGLYGDKSTMPATTVENGAVQSRALTSRLGHAVSFLDGTAPASQAIELVLAGEKHKVHLGKDKLTMEVPSGLPVEITAGETSVKFSQSGDITVQAPNVTVKADQKLALQGNQVSIQAESTMDIKAEVKVGVSGALLELQSQGPAKLAGMPVQIN